MRNAGKYAELLRKLHRSLLREGAPPPLEKLEPLRALLRGVMSYDVSDSRAAEAVRILEREFVNLNELRVATQLEVQELLGAKFPAIEQRVRQLAACLNAVFEREHTLSLEQLRTLGRKDARQYLRGLAGMSPFVEAYVMLFGLDAPAFPLDNESLNYLRARGIFEDTTTIEEAQKFLEQQFPGERCYEFFALLRRAVYAEPARRRRQQA